MTLENISFLHLLCVSLGISFFTTSYLTYMRIKDWMLFKFEFGTSNYSSTWFADILLSAILVFIVATVSTMLLLMLIFYTWTMIYISFFL